MNNTYKEKFIERYFNQQNSLPEKVKEFFGQKIELYALSDLDEDYKFCEKWLVATDKSCSIISRNGDDYELVKEFQIQEVEEITEISGTSLTTLVFVKSPELPPIGVLRFSRRQKVMMGHIKFWIESKIKKENINFEHLSADEEYLDSTLRPIIDAQNSVSNENLNTLFRLLSYLLPYKKELIIGSIGAISATLLSLAPAYLSGRLIDEVIKPFQDGSLDPIDALHMSWVIVGALGAGYLLKEISIWLRLNKMSMLGEHVAKDLRAELFEHLQTLSIDYFSKKNTGSIISRVSSDTDRLWDFIAFGVVEFSISIVSLIALSLMLITLDWRLGLIMSLPVPLLLFGIYFHGERMNKLFVKAWRKWSNLTSLLSDTIPGIQVVKAFNQETKEVKRFNHKNSIVTDEFYKIHHVWTRFWPALMLSFQVIVMTVWVFAIPRLVGDGEKSMYLSAGTFVSFLLYMTMFQTPIEVVGQVTRMLNRALSSAYRVFEVLDTRPTIINKPESHKLEKVKGSVEFKNVFFSYDGVRPIIKNLNFKVNPGEMIGLVGSSGGGKSTITKLISRFYDIQSGDILIDGINLEKIDLGLYRRQVGMVLQDPYLFQGSIWENIAYAKPKATRDEIIEAAQIANAHGFIGKLPYGYDTIIGERGHTLSGGERQRISIARAILADPRILILDEATSAVDTETERKIQEALDRLVKGRTVFAVAHRLSTLRSADRVFVIKDGEMAEIGTHTELLSKSTGEYYKLHQMQKEMSASFAL